MKKREYRKYRGLYYKDAMYSIQVQKPNGKWRTCFGSLTYDEANDYLTDPDLIESKRAGYRATGYLIIGFVVVCIIYYISWN